jgi:hypothetical protein
VLNNNKSILQVLILPRILLLDRRVMKYGVIISVFIVSAFAILLLSATVIKSVEGFPSSNNQVPNNAPVLNPSNNQVPNNAPLLIVLGSSTYTDSAGYYNIVGEVKNISYKTLKSVKVTAAISDSSNRIVDTVSAYTSLEELRPQQKSNFHIVFSDQVPIDQSGTYTLTVSPSEQTTPKLAQLQLNYENTRADSPDNFSVQGQVTNQGIQPANLVKVSASFYDVNNQLVDVENVYTQPPSLQPGESAPFEITVSRPSLPQIASVSFDVQSKEFSSVSMGQNVAVTSTINGATTNIPQLSSQQGSASLPPGYVYPGFFCGKDTHLNKKGQCVADRERDNNGNNGNNGNNDGQNDATKQDPVKDKPNPQVTGPGNPTPGPVNPKS